MKPGPGKVSGKVRAAFIHLARRFPLGLSTVVGTYMAVGILACAPPEEETVTLNAADVVPTGFSSELLSTGLGQLEIRIEFGFRDFHEEYVAGQCPRFERGTAAWLNDVELRVIAGFTRTSAVRCNLPFATGLMDLEQLATSGEIRLEVQSADAKVEFRGDFLHLTKMLTPFGTRDDEFTVGQPITVGTGGLFDQVLDARRSDPSSTLSRPALAGEGCSTLLAVVADNDLEVCYPVGSLLGPRFQDVAVIGTPSDSLELEPFCGDLRGLCFEAPQVLLEGGLRVHLAP